MKNQELTFEQNFKLLVLGLRLSCVKQSLRIAYPIGITCYGLYLTGYSLIFHDIKKDDHIEAYKNSFMAIVVINLMIKTSILIIYDKNIINCINVVNSDYRGMSSMTPEEKTILYKYIKIGFRICQLWLVISVFTATMFPAKAAFLMCYHGYKGNFKLFQVFELTLPGFLQTDNRTKELIIFVTNFIAQSIFACFGASMFLGFEPMCPIFMVHACGQLEIVEYKLMNLYSNPEDLQIIDGKLNEIISILQKVYKFVKESNSSFATIYEIGMKTFIIALPLTAMQVIEAARKSQISLEFTSFLIGVLMLQFVPCYYSDLLQEKGERVRQAIYACGWERHYVLKHRKALILMLSRAAKPPVMQSIFCTMCLDTFSDLCHSSYAIFNILNASS